MHMWNDMVEVNPERKKKKTTLKNLKVTELEVSEHKTITPDPNTYMIKTSK